MSNEIKHGFFLESLDKVPELQSTVHRYRHLKTGAELLYIENSDNNKVFGVAFRTPQNNSTGVPHIIEHCVLSGSRKYKTKEPFMNLVQSSLATFLNAMTFSDKTIYPVASRNDKDFRNLMDVYLDAVFYPNLYTDERIFRQEGWRYQLEDADAPLTYSGVVYNEMRGAFSSPFQVAYSETNQRLFPDTHYAYNSGGEPYTIPELSFEEFKDFHSRFYHPSNAKIFLYGDMDIEGQLMYLNDEYLSAFDAREVDSEIAFQEAFSEPREESALYSLAGGEDVTDKDYLVWSVALNKYSDLKANLMLEVLTDALFSTQSAPVRLALQQQDFCSDTNAFTDEKMQNMLAVFLINAKPEAKTKYQAIIEDTLRKLVKEGIDRDHLTASLNRMEYSLREGGGYTTMGILYFIKSLDSWLYDGDPLDQLRYTEALAELRESLSTDSWERFVEEKLIANPHKLLLHLQPQAGLNEAKDQQVLAKLAERKAQMSTAEIDDLVRRTRELAEWQNTEDSAEAKASIPRLSIADLETELPDPPCLTSEEEDDIVLEHPIFTSQIHYARYSFPLQHIAKEDLFYVSLLSLLLGSVDTDHHDYKQLSTAVFLETGGINYNPAIALKEPDEKVLFRMEVTLKTLDAQGGTWPELLTEILRLSRFDDDKRILELMRMQLVGKEHDISQQGDNFARNRLLSRLNLSSWMQEELAGVSYYLRLKQLIADFEENKQSLKENLKRVYNAAFNRGEVIVSLTTDEESMPTFRAAALRALSQLPNTEKVPVEWSFEEDPLNEGIQVSSNVQYVVKGFDFEKFKTVYDGRMNVLAAFLSKSYLHNQVRAQGGAYGTSLTLNRSGSLLASSYRDPHLKRSLDVYDGMGAWLREQDLTQAEVDQYIIGSMNRFNPPLNPAARGYLAYTRHLTGRSKELAESNLREALEANPEGLRNFAQLLDQAMAKNCYCVVGSAQVLEENKELFDRLIRI